MKDRQRSRILLTGTIPEGEETRMSSIDVHQHTEQKSFDNPDEVREFPNGRAEIVKIGDGEVGRYTFQPGWHWENDVKPIVGTHSCEVPHFQYHVSAGWAFAWTTAPSWW